MKVAGGGQLELGFPEEAPRPVRLAATDLSNHLACRHVTTLDLSVARGELEAPAWAAPDLAVIQELGLRHEAAYLASLDDGKGSLLNLRDVRDEKAAVAETIAAMKRGVPAIAQGSLALGRWFGKPDVLRRVEKAGRWDWSYEAYDCKLSRETKAATILQLALYSDLLREIQGLEPEWMHVVVPRRNFVPERYRFADFAAYHRHVKARLERASDDEACAKDAAVTYPEPCEHCNVCRWFKECDARRRNDDHLSLVAGIRSLQRKQLVVWHTDTMAKLAEMPLPLNERPAHGSRDSYDKIREQARVQVAGRTGQKLVHEHILPVTDGMGFSRLPQPSPGDVFVDLEGDPFAGEHGQEYLFGFASRPANGNWAYDKRWAFNAEEEKHGFEWLVDEIMRRWAADPAMHVYHFGAYEPSAFKKLMGIYTRREDEIDRMLRAHLFVDLHTIFKQALRASVEEYSLKKLEAFYAFERRTPLDESRKAMRYVEHHIELGWQGELNDEMRRALEGYNGDDCRSTGEMREWLERERQAALDAGAAITRPELRDGTPAEELNERQKRVAALVAKLTDRIPADATRTPEEQARWMLAQLLDWHRRENKATWWEGFRLAELDDEDLLDERAGLGGLCHVRQLSFDRKIAVDRYTFEKQETTARAGDDVYRRDPASAALKEQSGAAAGAKNGEKRSEKVGERIGEIVAIDLVNRTVDIKKTRKTATVHPPAVFAWDGPLKTDNQADALFRIGEWVAQHGVDTAGDHRAGRDLLLRKPPRLLRNETLTSKPLESSLDAACRIGAALDESVFAIQGPPGAGKTYTGGRMICQLVQAGKKVGVTALSHKVIQKLLKEAVDAAGPANEASVRCLQKLSEDDQVEAAEGIVVTTSNEDALAALARGSVNVLGATSFLWTRDDFAGSVDTLFIDEAGQLALADVLAVSQAARNLVLIGDPQQLQRPLKGSHPPGAEKSALEHLLGEHKTIRPEMGLLLPSTHRLHPKICAFTSELFYESRLDSDVTARNRELDGHPWLAGAGLWFVPVEHDGNSNSSAEEVDKVAEIVESLLRPEVGWFYGIGNRRALKREDDILVVAPYNAQVGDLAAKLPGVQVGTVDKFQGQQAAVVIYSMTTSSPEDAPRGMEFLYSLNRLNVATSRAMTNVILVGSPRLFEPECRNPRQMQLANALCRYLELAKTVAPWGSS